MDLIEIKGDLFDIAGRLKEIDSRYTVCRNVKLNRFEIHADGVLQIAVPFDRLDARTVELVRSTRLENVGRLLEQINSDNERLEKASQISRRNELLARVEDAL